MHLKAIRLINFRSFDLFERAFNKTNIIYGRNASGKTNLIEGIYTILNGHSFLRRNTPLKKDPEKETVLYGFVDEREIKIRISNREKQIRVNGKKSDIITLKREFPTLLYSIETFLSFRSKAYILSLLDRTAFIDDETVADLLVEYRKLKRVKQSALRSTKKDINLLEVTNRRLIEIINRIFALRKEALDNLEGFISEACDTLKLGNIKTVFSYSTINTNPAKKEIVTGRSLLSLQRCDIQLILNGKELFVFSSVGEKKMALLAIIVAIARYYNRKKQPILLVDDLEGDLDEGFRKRALDLLLSLPNQLFLTTLGEYLYNEHNIIRLDGGQTH